MSNINLIRNAKVESRKVLDKRQNTCLKIVINNQYEHTFASNSRETALLFSSDQATINRIMTGGTFLILDDKMVDYRTSDYKGFIHSDEGIEELSALLGINQTKGKKAAKGLYGSIRSAKTNGFMLGKEWDKFDLEVSSLQEGGHFTNKLIYQWSPFSNTVKSSIDVERLVCTNGMVGTAPFVVMDIPLINCWEEHLDMSTTILKPKYQDILSHRFADMTKQPASLKDLMFVYDSLNGLSENSVQPEHMKKIVTILNELNPSLHLTHVYRDKAFQSKHSEHLPSHLTQFDLMNVMTEVSTHYVTNDLQSAFQRKANNLVFDSFSEKPSLTLSTPVVTVDNHNKVFFGE